MRSTRRTSLLENLGPEAQVVIRFGASGQDPQPTCAAARALPLYADRSFILTEGMEGFLDGLPLMSRLDLRRQFPRGFLPAGIGFGDLIASEKAEVVRTSGTSSDRLQVLWTPGWWARQERAALITNPYIRDRLDDNYREAVLTTPLCSENVCQTGPTPMEARSFDYLLFLNTQHDPSRWNTGDLTRMVEEIERFHPTAIDGDPAYLASLAYALKQNGQNAPSIQWATLAYELVCAHDKAVIEQVFRCPTFDFYGLTEAGVFFLECLHHRHHFCATDAVVEVLRPAESPLPAGMGEIVVTAWGNQASPLLRYRTWDLVVVGSNDCPCGVPGPTLRSFEGRVRDVIEFSDGRVSTPRQLDDALAGVMGLVRYRAVQEKPDAVRLDYVANGAGDLAEELRRRLTEFWPGVNLTIKPCNFIPPEPSGKYRTQAPFESNK